MEPHNLPLPAAQGTAPLTRRALFAGGASLAAGLCAGCAAPQAAAEDAQPVRLRVKVPTLQMTAGSDPECLSAYDFLAKAAAAFSAERPDVEVEVQEFEIAEETREVQEYFGTADAADVLYEGYFNMAGYVHTGYVVPLDDIVTDELRADIDQSYWDMSSVNGKVYMMPFLSMQNTLCYNADLLRDVGLGDLVGPADQVGTWDWDQWEQVLAGLRAAMPEDSYPMMMYAADDQGDTHIMTLLRSKGSSFFDQDGRFCLSTDEGVAALQWIVDSYEKGYFPAGCETLAIIDNYNLFLTGREGVYMSNAVLEGSSYQDAGFERRAVNFPTLDGSGCATTFVTGFQVFDNGDEATVQAAKDLVAFVYATDFVNYQADSIPCSRSVAERRAQELAPVRKYVENTAANVDFTANNPNWRGVRDAFWPHIQDLLMGTVSAADTAAAIDADCNAAIEQGYRDSVVHD